MSSGSFDLKKIPALQDVDDVNSSLDYLFFLFFIVFPSLFVVSKIGGKTAELIYVLLSFTGFYICKKNMAYYYKISMKGATLFLYLIILFLFISILIGFPIADSGLWGGGSDMDEALEISVRALLSGHFPYYQKTYLGAPITPMPGAILLSVPFVLLNLVQFQNLFWIIILAFVLKKEYGCKVAVLVFLLPLVFSPTILHNLIIGSDYISNSLYVFIFLHWVIEAASWRSERLWKVALPSLCLGIGLSSRIIFLPLIIPLLVYLRRTVGGKCLFLVLFASLGAFCVLTLPFYLFDPRGFSPLHTMGFVQGYGMHDLTVKVVMLVLTGIAGLAPLMGKIQPSRKSLVLSGAAFLITPVVLNTAFALIANGNKGIFFSFYGVFSVFWGAYVLTAPDPPRPAVTEGLELGEISMAHPFPEKREADA